MTMRKGMKAGCDSYLEGIASVQVEAGEGPTGVRDRPPLLDHKQEGQYCPLQATSRWKSRPRGSNAIVRSRRRHLEREIYDANRVVDGDRFG